ncbi:hypothetical protein KEM52_000613 [Ascosphaera acerosa]|nr:hypothetical protein KEM52_000613 [Ascosphaera acerosa]
MPAAVASFPLRSLALASATARPSQAPAAALAAVRSSRLGLPSSFSTSSSQSAWARGAVQQRSNSRGRGGGGGGGRGGLGFSHGQGRGGGGSRRPAEPVVELQPDTIEDADKVTKFQQLADMGSVSPKVIDIITQEMGLTDMTDVQRLTVNACLQGHDVLAQAKTGTGKTLGFLLPVIQNMLKDPSLETRRGLWSADHSDIRAIIISPTRELAEQIAVEARRVVRKTGIVVQTAVGGNQKREALQKMQREGCHVLIGTPGRLIDIFSDPRSGVSAPKLQCLVLDEADRLLDDGFAPDIAELQRHFPARADCDRQTLMFSATVPREVTRMVRRTMKPDFKFVKTVDENEQPTHLSVPQKLVFLRGLENELPALLELFSRGIAEHKADPAAHPPFKPIVYFNSTAEVRLAMEAYKNIVDAAFRQSPRPEHIPRLDCTEMHSRLSQAARTRNSTYFRNSQSCVLFSSDVTARGMDFPNVTHVIQVGVPRDRETYIHRLGRTARANRKGEGWLLVHDVEVNDLRSKLRGLPLTEDSAALATSEMHVASPPASADAATTSLLEMTRAAYGLVPLADKYDAFRAYFGVYGNANKRRLVEMVNDLATDGWGLPEPLPVSPTLALKMGLRNVPGVKIGEIDIPREEPRRGFAGGGRGGGHAGAGRQRDSRFSPDSFGRFDGARSRANAGATRRPPRRFGDIVGGGGGGNHHKPQPHWMGRGRR